MKLQVKAVPADAIKQVKAFQEIETRIMNFKSLHSEIFQQFAYLLDEYNDALTEADREVRALGVSCAPFVICGETTKIDAQKLYDELGEEAFLKVGGVIEIQRIHSIEKNTFETMANDKSIPQEVVDSCRSQSLRYTTPKKIELP